MIVQSKNFMDCQFCMFCRTLIELNYHFRKLDWIWSLKKKQSALFCGMGIHGIKIQETHNYKLPVK